MLPFQVQVLVFPGHIDTPGFNITAVFADLGDVERKASAHRFSHSLGGLLLCRARFGPEPLDHLAAMFDFNESAALIVASAPQCDKCLAGLNLPGRSGQEMRN